MLSRLRSIVLRLWAGSFRTRSSHEEWRARVTDEIRKQAAIYRVNYDRWYISTGSRFRYEIRWLAKIFQHLYQYFLLLLLLLFHITSVLVFNEPSNSIFQKKRNSVCNEESSFFLLDLVLQNVLLHECIHPCGFTLYTPVRNEPESSKRKRK